MWRSLNHDSAKNDGIGTIALKGQKDATREARIWKKYKRNRRLVQGEQNNKEEWLEATRNNEEPTGVLQRSNKQKA